MTRDYAGKGRSSRRGAQRRGKAPAKKPFPWPMALLATALLCLFGYVLVSIKGASEGRFDEPEPVPTAPVATPKPEPKPETALPEPPKEEWGYIDRLIDNSVEVELPEVQASGGPYQMQCGSFRTEAQADTMRATIAFQGMESQVRRTEGSNGVWYRVVLGPYERKRAAEAHRHALQRAGINGCQIWNWN
ncbi:SPOR domain-containing protein [Ferrimonas marina]|uniref:Cell division protein FtsN n=1 Tax=Ferrimonas marina TaxID=299255 RepID=A0A1M5XYI5_9GAMM|nr:SPOR domain-containing protein [Ferrimonas marina]SHI04792.1 cell division protein FtsN [Ferrimonas marina]